MGRFWIAVAALALAIALVGSEEVSFQPCSSGSDDQCSVSNVTIVPCREAPRPCRLRKKHNATITFDYEPKFAAQRLRTDAYWADGGLEPRFTDLDSDGCKFTTCPTQANVKSTFTYTLYIAKNTPKGSYLIKWVLKNEDNKNQVCCFVTNIVIG